MNKENSNVKIVIEIPERVYIASQLLIVKHEDTIQLPLETIAKGIPYDETVTDFADRCKECGKMRKMHTLKKISNECNNRIDCNGCEFYIDYRCCIGGMPETWNLDLIDNHEKGEEK